MSEQNNPDSKNDGDEVELPKYTIVGGDEILAIIREFEAELARAESEDTIVEDCTEDSVP